MPDPNAIGSFIENFGFPVAVAIAASGMVWILVRQLLAAKDSEIASLKALNAQERADRVDADKRLTIATGELKEVTTRVEELTKEVIRSARPH